jgi:hypothetical protein
MTKENNRTGRYRKHKNITEKENNETLLKYKQIHLILAKTK